MALVSFLNPKLYDLFLESYETPSRNLGIRIGIISGVSEFTFLNDVLTFSTSLVYVAYSTEFATEL